MPDLIVTHRTGANARDQNYRDLDYRGLLTKKRLQVGIEPVDLTIPMQTLPAQVLAYVSGGRWIAECEGCETAVVVDDEDLLFYCPGCATNGYWQRVILPDEREEIERLLLLRPGWQFNAPRRNWFPGESVQDLQRENVEHGVGV